MGFEGVPKPTQAGPPLMIGGGSPRVLGIAGREADIVSLNFDNRSGVLGPDSVGSGSAEQTARKIDWIRAGAEQRTDGRTFDDLELEIAAYFTVVTDERDAALAAMAGRMGAPPEALAEHPHTLIGSVDDICEQLEARRVAYGISYVTIAGRAAPGFAPVVDRLAGK